LPQGFELSSEQVDVSATLYREVNAGDVREAEARLRVDRGLEVGYSGFYGCTP